VKKPYFFGYLFVKAAKGLAFFVMLIGIGFCLLQYFQAKAAISAVAYQPSTLLQRALGELKKDFSATERFVSSFNTDNQLTVPRIQVPGFPALIASNADFVRVGETLSRVDQERQQLKQSIVSRFEASVKTIEEKLRAYAAGLESLPPPTDTPVPSRVSTATPLPSPTPQQESFFSAKLGVDEINKRSAILNRRKEFLKVLGTKAESADNRARLNEAVDQLELLSRLLPEKSETSVTSQVEPAPTPSNEPRPEQGRKVLLSERVAAQLEQVRGEVNQILLTSWTLDDTFDHAADLNSVERDKCRIATLAQKRIWLSAASRMIIALLAAVFGSFLILVSADLVRTQLDAANNTYVVADAINALRGRPSAQSESH